MPITTDPRRTPKPAGFADPAHAADNDPARLSPQPMARACGLMYLVIIGLGLFGEVSVRGSIVVSGDAAATLAGIAAHQSWWRLGIATGVVMHVLDVPTTVLL